MTLASRNILSIIECIFYVPTTFLSLFLCIRHCCRGQRSQIAWIFLYIYCHIRVAEAALGLATITYPSVAVYGTSILFSLIGVPAILLTTFGLLNRVYINLGNKYPTRIKAWHFSLLQIPFEAAIGICARGASNSTADASNGSAYRPQVWTKVGIMLCVVGFMIMSILTGAMLRRQSRAETDERRLLHTITLSLPFLCIRMIYTVLVTFMDRDLFKSYEGDVLVIGVMAVLPEMVVVIIYMAEGFTLQQLPKDIKKKNCQRKKGGWPSQPELLDDASIARTDSEQGWKDLDDGSSTVSCMR
jgi:hypothetical protein